MNWFSYFAYGAGAVAVLILARHAFASPSAPALDTSGGKPPSKWTDADYRALDALSRRLGVPSPNVLAVLRSESGLNPQAEYPGGLAKGLNQLTDAGRVAVGMSPSEFDSYQDLSVAEQLPVVERSFRSALAGARPKTAGSLYAYNFLPAYARKAGDNPDAVLAPVSEFPADRPLDYDGDGYYEVRDLSNHLRRYAKDPLYLGALQAMRDATGDQSLSPVW